MNLRKIEAGDLKFTGHLEDDRTNTYLELNDYDWMTYKLSTRFKTDKYGTLQVEFEYFGAVDSLMKVTQIINNVSDDFEFSYPTSIFIKHIKKFMTDHINSWDDKYVFNGEKNVLDFYNEVIEVGTLK